MKTDVPDKKKLTLHIDDFFKDCEYLILKKNGKVIHTFQASELADLKKTDVQKLIGEKFGNVRFYCSGKFKGQYRNKTFQMQGITFGANNNINQSTEDKNLMDNKILDEKMAGLEKSIEKLKASDSGISFEMLLQITKDSYDFKLDVLKTQLKDKDKEILQLETKIKTLESDIKDMENEIAEAGESNNLLSLVSKFAEFKNLLKPGTGGAVLKDIPSNATDIPDSFINALGKIDYNQIPPDEQTRILSIFENFANQLPLKKVEA